MPYKPLIVLAIAVPTLILLFRSTNSRWLLLCAGIASTTFGHRAVYVGHWLYFVPLEIVLWLLLIVILPRARRGPPHLIGCVLVWALLRGGVTLLAGGDWDSILAWTSPLVVGLPAFLAVSDLVDSPPRLRTLLEILFWMSLAISVFGLAEYFIPQLPRLAPWFYREEDIHNLATNDGFVRAPFSFFGYPAAATVVTWGMLVAYNRLFSVEPRSRRLSAGVAFLINLVAVYVSGQRSSWVGLALGILLMSLYLGPEAILGATTLAALATTLLPGVFWSRLGTIVALITTGVPLDTSLESRFDRWDSAWQAMLDSPLSGVGYGKDLAHNLFLELGRTLGVVPALLMALFVVQLLWRTAVIALSGPTQESRRMGLLFSALAVLIVVQMCVETNFSTPVFAAASWVLIALAWRLPTIYRSTQYALLTNSGRPKESEGGLVLSGFVPRYL